jgi:hypothetical protein
VILYKVEASHHLISIQLHFILTNLITEDGPQTFALMIAISTQLLGECFFTTYNETKIKKYTVPTIHRKKVGIGKFDIPHINKHDRSWLSRSISIKSDGVKLVYSRFFFTALLLFNKNNRNNRMRKSRDVCTTIGQWSSDGLWRRINEPKRGCCFPMGHTSFVRMKSFIFRYNVRSISSFTYVLYCLNFLVRLFFSPKSSKII